MPVYFAYYADIMLDAFGYQLCFLLSWHIWPGPNYKSLIIYLQSLSESGKWSL